MHAEHIHIVQTHITIYNSRQDAKFYICHSLMWGKCINSTASSYIFPIGTSFSAPGFFPQMNHADILVTGLLPQWEDLLHLQPLTGGMLSLPCHNYTQQILLLQFCVATTRLLLKPLCLCAHQTNYSTVSTAKKGSGSLKTSLSFFRTAQSSLPCPSVSIQSPR